MAIVLKKGNLMIKIDSYKIVGIMGRNYYEFINSFKGNKIGYVCDNNFIHEKVIDELKSYYLDNNFDEIITNYLKEFDYENDFLEKKISELSDSEQRILKYLSVFISNNSIFVIDNVYQDLDYYYKKKIKYWLKKMVKEYKKTIVIGSNNSDDIYDICQKVLLIDKDNYCYDDASVIMTKSDLLKKYEVRVPQIIEFVNICHQKKVLIDYTNDIRDLIKEVYKNV